MQQRNWRHSPRRVALGNVLDDVGDAAKEVVTDYVIKPVGEVLNFAKYTVMGVIGTWGLVKGVQIAGPSLAKTMGKLSDTIAGSRTPAMRKKVRGTAARRRRNYRLSR